MTDSEFQALMGKRGCYIPDKDVPSMHMIFRLFAVFDVAMFSRFVNAVGVDVWLTTTAHWERLDNALRAYTSTERKAAAEKRLAELAAQIRETEQELEACEMEGRLYLKA